VRRLRDLGEHAWLARLARRLARGRGDRRVLVGPGDDAAVVVAGRRTCLTTDALVEGVHFRRAWITPAALGRRAFAVNASDLAAMGARPRFALLAVEVSPACPVADLDALVDGFAVAARRAGARLVGGNLTARRGLAVTVTLVGDAPGPIVGRTGARPGDALYLTGTVGGAGLAVRRLRAGGRGRLPELPSRVRAGGLLARVAHAMIDVSDGVVQDLGHLCRASRVGAELELASLPMAPGCRRALGRRAARFAATAGEDYELLLAVPADREGALARLRPALGCRLTRIGRIVDGPRGVQVLDAQGRRVRLARGGFDHFR
jgi:thiamine-monophosphate kinase